MPLPPRPSTKSSVADLAVASAIWEAASGTEPDHEELEYYTDDEGVLGGVGVGEGGGSDVEFGGGRVRQGSKAKTVEVVEVSGGLDAVKGGLVTTRGDYPGREGEIILF
jgi:hypothetical protein